MLVKDILNTEINIGDEVIVASQGYMYKAKILKETEKSVAYDIFDKYSNKWIGLSIWARKSNKVFNNMYKI